MHRRSFLSALFVLGVAMPAFAVTPISMLQYTIKVVPLPPGGLTITPTGLNASGQAVGQVFDGGYYSFFYDGATTTTTSLPGGAYAVGINDFSTICGWYSVQGIPYVYTQHGGTIKQIGAWNAQGTYPTGINNSEQIAGAGVDPPTQNYRALLYTAGVFKNLGTVGGSSTTTSASALNRKGDVVGAWDANSSGPDKPMIYTDGAMHVFGGSLNAIAQGINDSRQVVGEVEGGSGMGFFYDYPSNTFTTVAPPSGFDGCQLRSINNAGTAVGLCSTQSSIDAAIYMPGQTMTDLNQLIDPSLGWHLDSAAAINDNGQILVRGIRNHSGGEQVLILTPVPTPEPAATSLLALGCVGLLARKGRRRISSQIEYFLD